MKKCKVCAGYTQWDRDLGGWLCVMCGRVVYVTIPVDIPQGRFPTDPELPALPDKGHRHYGPQWMFSFDEFGR